MHLLDSPMFTFFKPKFNIRKERSPQGLKIIYKPRKSIYSGFQLRFIPTDPYETWSDITVDQLMNYLLKKFPKNEIILELNSSVVFVDCGEGFEEIVCPNCGEKIEIKYWQQMMDKAYEGGFTDLSTVTGCCQYKTDLNSLKYRQNCGFSKSIITVINPESDLEEDTLLVQLKKISNTDLRIIHSHI